MKKFSASKLARAAIIAALYAGLTLLFAPISYGVINLRVAECLCLLAIIYPEAIAGLTIGCLIANIYGGALDMLLGSLATFLAAFSTFLAAKFIKGKWLKYGICVFFEVFFNALLVPIIILFGSNSEAGYFILALQVGGGELGVLLTFGVIFYIVIMRQFAKNGDSV